MPVLRIRVHHKWKFEDISEFVSAVERVKRGTVLHKALSLIERPVDFEGARFAVRSAILMLGEALDGWNIDELAGSIMKIFDLKETSLFFPEDRNVRVYSEREFLDTPTSVVRPDRVVEFSDEVVVVDFKASRPRSLKTLQSYLKQVRKYVSVVSSVLGKPASGYLLYVDPPGVERVV